MKNYELLRFLSQTVTVVFTDGSSVPVTVTKVEEHGCYVTYSTGQRAYLFWHAIRAMEEPHA